MIDKLTQNWPAWIRIPLLIISGAIFAIALLLLAIVLVIVFGGHVATAEAVSCPTFQGQQYCWDIENPYPYPGTFIGPSESVPSDPSLDKKCWGAHISDRVRSFPSHDTIGRIYAHMGWCGRQGIVVDHHWNTRTENCCAPFWSLDGPSQRKTVYKTWKGRPKGSFMGVYQQRFKFCPGVGPIHACVDHSVLTIRMIVYPDGRHKNNTNVPSI